ncbi:hypothetical protein DFH06DRAFT_1139037 [Mycena polygramma]|nr:hypothetical protein DFH06DRAFT_1139037 [Mycena polygramma]
MPAGRGDLGIGGGCPMGQSIVIGGWVNAACIHQEKPPSQFSDIFHESFLKFRDEALVGPPALTWQAQRECGTSQPTTLVKEEGGTYRAATLNPKTMKFDKSEDCQLITSRASCHDPNHGPIPPHKSLTTLSYRCRPPFAPYATLVHLRSLASIGDGRHELQVQPCHQSLSTSLLLSEIPASLQLCFLGAVHVDLDPPLIVTNAYLVLSGTTTSSTLRHLKPATHHDEPVELLGQALISQVPHSPRCRRGRRMRALRPTIPVLLVLFPVKRVMTAGVQGLGCNLVFLYVDRPAFVKEGVLQTCHEQEHSEFLGLGLALAFVLSLCESGIGWRIARDTNGEDSMECGQLGFEILSQLASRGAAIESES